MNEIDHFIERHILKVLMLTSSAHFSQMRPHRVDSNLYSYHLSKLLKLKYVKKDERKYSLDSKGLAYVDRISFDSFQPRIQPKINTGILLKNIDNKILLSKRKRQPLIGLWGLPMGKIHEDDRSLLEAAKRESLEKVGVDATKLSRIGGCYMRTYKDGILISSSMSHIFMQSDLVNFVDENENLRWFCVNELDQNDVIRGVDEIVQRSEEGADFFVEVNNVLE